MIDWAWVGEHLDDVAFRAVQHVVLAGIALVVGFAIAFAVAILATRVRPLYAPIATVAAVVFTIPSLAMFAALVPATGFSLLTAEVPLVLYTQFIYIRNIVAGFDAIPADVREAADGMGYTAWGRLRRVELPLAVPLIVAGIRLASVSTIGLVTITALLGDNFGGLGFFILEGYRHSFPTEILVGAIPSIAVAVAADLGFVAVQRRITPWAAAGRGPAGGTVATGSVPAGAR